MLKRLTDITLALVILALGFPFILVVLFIVYIITGESPLLFQDRWLTLEKSGIRIMKIRTIRSRQGIADAGNIPEEIFIKKEYESYVPYFCRWLRKSGIDELPQLINVLKGEMSIVGPRPLTKSDLLLIKNEKPVHYKRRSRLNSKPGITGYWQIYGNREKGIEELTGKESYYEMKKSTVLDLRIMGRTLYVFFTAGHSDSILGNKKDTQKAYPVYYQPETLIKTNL